jgi:hypothetical protein
LADSALYAGRQRAILTGYGTADARRGPVGVIIIAAIITVAVVALLFVVNARLNRRSPELEDYPKKPDGADDVWFTGGPGGS